MLHFNKYQNLGMWIDKNLNWNYHVDKMCSKLSRRLGILLRVKFNLPKETLFMLYNSIVLPLFDYGDVVYGNYSAITLKRLQVLQNRGTRMLLDCDYRTHSVNMLSELKWLNIKDRLNFHKMCLVYKCSNVSDKHEHHTRAQTRQHLTLVKPKNNQLKRSFKYSGALNCNNLNPVIRNATSLNIFKSAYLKSHFNH